MKYLSILPVVALLAACSDQAGESAVIRPPQIETANESGPFSTDNLARAEACFKPAGERETFLVEGQSLFERGSDGWSRAAFRLNGETGSFDYPALDLPLELRQRLDRAGADFYREAGVLYDPTTDRVIYERTREGRFCTVVKSIEITENLAASMTALRTDIDTQGIEIPEDPRVYWEALDDSATDAPVVEAEDNVNAAEDGEN